MFKRRSDLVRFLAVTETFGHSTKGQPGGPARKLLDHLASDVKPLLVDIRELLHIQG